MSIEDSRIPGFFRLTVNERREKMREMANLSQKHIDAWSKNGELSDNAADRVIENVIGTMSLPIGVATNFVIDSKPHLIPFVLEEPSVVAAASNMAKRCLIKGGFTSNCDDPVMIGQIQLVNLPDPNSAIDVISQASHEIIQKCNAVDPILVKFGGGCKSVTPRLIKTDSGDMIIVHLHVDCRDAMGANAVNTMAETVAPFLSKITGGTPILRIISNLAVHRLARVKATFTPAEMADSDSTENQGKEIIKGVIQAFHFAKADPYRATTHNKGIMNAISAIALACGQDWRAIEAGAHSFAAHERRYTSLTTWKQDSEGNLVGTIELPMAVGLVGGAVRVHPAAKANVALLGVKTANELAAAMAAAGLAQNLGALRALATVGIQAGHMKLHARNMAVSAGATDEEIDSVVNHASLSGERITHSSIQKSLEQIRKK